MEKVKLTIDNVEVCVKPNTTIVEAAQEAGIEIPTLCYLKGVNCEGSCRVCVVEVNGKENLSTACNTNVFEGMSVVTNNTKVMDARKRNIELLLSNHNKDCLSCAKNTNCKLQKLSYDFGCDEQTEYAEKTEHKIDDSSLCIVRDNSKCILCNRCVSMCKNIEATNAIAKMERGYNTYIGCAFNKPLKDSTCVGCGQCALVCPTGALLEKSHIQKVLDLIDGNNFVVAQIAPSVRVALSEEFDNKIGTFNEGKMVEALKRIGFNKVFDVNVGADFTVIEESQELINRITQNGVLPMFSSCCPAWVKFINQFYPEYTKNLSTCKSPNEMLGAVVKQLYAKQLNTDVSKIKVVAIMPCTAKKQEIVSNEADVDVVITTRELATLIKYKNILFNNLPETSFDMPFGESTGAGLIFGVTGGVTEAVVRTLADKLTGVDNEDYEIKSVRDNKGIKEVTLTIGDSAYDIAVVYGLSNAKEVMENIKSGKKNYQFVEYMACPGGCVNGGGQPYVDYTKTTYFDVPNIRAKSLFNGDKTSKVKKSHKNLAVKKIYDEFLGPNNLNKILHHKH